MKKGILIVLILLVLAALAVIAWKALDRAEGPSTSAPLTFEESGTRLEGVLYTVPGTTSKVELRGASISFNEGTRDIRVIPHSEFERSFLFGEPYVVLPVSVVDGGEESLYLALFEGAGAEIEERNSVLVASESITLESIALEGETIELTGQNEAGESEVFEFEVQDGLLR